MWSEASRSDLGPYQGTVSHPEAPADSVSREPAPCSSPDSSPESYLLPTRPARRPAPHASDTSPGVTLPSGPRLISVCIQPSPWARWSVGVVEHGESRFLRPDPSPWWGRRGSGTFSTSHECSPGETPTLHPCPFGPLFFLFMLPCWPWHC